MCSNAIPECNKCSCCVNRSEFNITELLSRVGTRNKTKKKADGIFVIWDVYSIIHSRVNIIAS